MGLFSILLKLFVIPGYTPAEDLIDAGFDVAKDLAKSKTESIDARLKAEGFGEDRIKAVKTILTESADRFVPNTPAAIYSFNADSMRISRQIFKAYREEQESTELCLTDESENEQIIKGISLIVQKALDPYLTSSEYVEYLTKKQNKSNASIGRINKEQEISNRQLEDHEIRITNLEQDDNQRSSVAKKKLKRYYNHVMGLYTKRITGNVLLGEESLSELYMQPYYYKSQDETGDVEELIEDFILAKDISVLWIVGEPGHGKTSMCIKAVADYVNEKRYQSAPGVFWFRLNPQSIPGMLENQKLALRKVFSWELIDGDRSETIEPDEIKGSLVFLDGYDELKSSLGEHSISDEQFYSQVNQIAETFGLHIVVTSRMGALDQAGLYTEESLKKGKGELSCEFRDGSSLKNTVRLMAPLTNEKQLEWIDGLITYRKGKNEDTSELEKYRHTFQSLQEKEDLSELLAIPILLRMIVQNCFEPSSNNRVELYSDLFYKTLIRQGLDDQKEALHAVYREIAFRIFVYNNDCAEIKKEELSKLTGNNAFLYQYYLHTPKTDVDEKDKYRITFLHRSFYQYFLSEFLYEKLKMVTDNQSGENFLRYLWVRRLDPYVLENLHYKAKDECLNYKLVLEALGNTDGFLPEYANTSDTREHPGNFNKANNTFWNAVSLCNHVFVKRTDQEYFELDWRSRKLLSKYDCDKISLREASLSYALLFEAKLIEADLGSARLNSADLSFAKLFSAKLSSAKLHEADLNHANLSLADLRSAKLIYADLSNASLNCADLRSADLSYANLLYANLDSADLTEAILDQTFMAGANVANAKVTKEQYNYISKAEVKNLDQIIIVEEN